MPNLTSVQRASLKKKQNRQKYKQRLSEKEKTIEVQPKEPDLTIEEYVELLQENYATNVKNIKESDDEDYIKTALVEGEEIWLNVRILVESEKYKTMNDGQKVDLIQKDFPEFYKNFPVVSRYAICMGQYSAVAFKKMLIKCKETKTPSEVESNPELKKDMNEKLWIQRQADYIRFLWEEIQDNKFEQSESDAVWDQSVESLTAEFKQFKDMHEAAEKRNKLDDFKNKKELLYELSGRIIDGSQKLDDNASKYLVHKLQDRLFNQRFKKMIVELSESKLPIDAVSEGVGINEYAKHEYDDELKQAFYKKTYKKMDINKLAI